MYLIHLNAKNLQFKQDMNYTPRIYMIIQMEWVSDTGLQSFNE